MEFVPFTIVLEAASTPAYSAGHQVNGLCLVWFREIFFAFPWKGVMQRPNRTALFGPDSFAQVTEKVKSVDHIFLLLGFAQFPHFTERRLPGRICLPDDTLSV